VTKRTPPEPTQKQQILSEVFLARELAEDAPAIIRRHIRRIIEATKAMSEPQKMRP
jgi:hypothetical protein